MDGINIDTNLSPEIVVNQMITLIIVAIVQALKTAFPKLAPIAFFIGLFVSIILMFLAALAFKWDMNVYAIIFYGIFAGVTSSATYDKSNKS